MYRLGAPYSCGDSNVKDPRRILFGDWRSILNILVVAVAILCLVLLTHEVHFFWREARELAALKEDYANYVVGFKRAIADTQRPPEASSENGSEQDGSKKKMSDGSGVEFSPVNRDPSALYAAGLSHARAAGIEDVWCAWQAAPAVRTNKCRRIRARRGARAPQPVQQRTQSYGMEVANKVLLSEASFVWPIDIKLFRITSHFGPRRWGFHHGLDMAAPHGTPVKVVAHGVVIEARRTKGWGKTVVVSHSDKLKTRYAHLSSIDVSVGDSVQQGQRIGRVGNTGHVRGRNGIHLHLEVLVYGKRVNPLLFYRHMRRR